MALLHQLITPKQIRVEYRLETILIKNEANLQLESIFRDKLNLHLELDEMICFPLRLSNSWQGKAESVEHAGPVKTATAA